MDDIIDSITQWRARGERLALAPVIKVDGSAPRAEGAKMAISATGMVAGSVSGGCVESAVAEEAKAVIRSGTPTIARYGINRDMMWEIGLSCGGAIHVFIEPFDALPDTRAGGAFAVCTIVRGPGGIGRKIVVAADGSITGELGNGELQAQAAALARELIDAGRSTTVAAGEHQIFVDVSIPRPQVILVGAVHIAMALCAMAVRAGFAVTVIDPRPALCNRERFPAATSLIVEWPDEALPRLMLDENTYVAVLTHDEKFDDPTLLRVLPSRARYVGAIGSRKTQALRRTRLLEAGIPAEIVERLHGPIGLDIGAQSPEEIAVAILAEMIAAKYHRMGMPLRDRVDPRIHT